MNWYPFSTKNFLVKENKEFFEYLKSACVSKVEIGKGEKNPITDQKNSPTSLVYNTYIIFVVNQILFICGLQIQNWITALLLHPILLFPCSKCFKYIN